VAGSVKETAARSATDPQESSGAAGEERSHEMATTKQSPSSGASYASESVAEKSAFKGVLIIMAIVAVVIVSLLYATGHSASVVSTITVYTTVHVPAPSQSNAVAIVTSQNITVRTGNSVYLGNSIIGILGNVSPAPSALGSNAIVSVTNPNGVLVLSVGTPISAEGRFSVNVVGGSASAWINGTYTVTSSYMGSSGRTAFVWSPVKKKTVTTTLVGTVCLVYTEVRSDIFILCIALLLCGAMLYAVGHAISGSLKSKFEGYGLGMMLGAIVSVVIALLAFYLLSTISGSVLPIASCASPLL